MKMKALEQRTGVNREVIRILIRKGLIPEPERAARNVADYDERHVAAIAAVRDLQQTSRLTLREIRCAIEGGRLEQSAPVAAYRQLEELLAIRFGLNEPRLIPLTSLEGRYPHARHDAAVFESMGMLKLIICADEQMISLTDARLVEIWGEIREAGFIEEAGFPPENIGFYHEAAEFVAEREARLFLEQSRGQIAQEHAAVMLHRALPLMLDFFNIIRIKSFMQNINKFNYGSSRENFD